jgi:4a-hydroxytetrahydrobiopterin dehydratase
MPDHSQLTRQQVSDAVSPLGWRLVLGAVYTEVDVAALVQSAEVATIAAAGVGTDGQDPGSGDRAGRLQGLEIAIDAMDIANVRPFWQAVTGYIGEVGPSDLTAGLIDPMGRGPAIWFQEMDEPRPQRNRIHIDVDVPHDEGEARVLAAITAGGTLLSDTRAPAFWVLADPEGNEACVCTWQARD